VNKIDKQTLVKKSKFAQMCNVSAGRVSQWIAEGIIGPEALVGEGQRALVDVTLAFRHLQERLDPSQRFSLNGLNTRLNGEASPSEADLDEEWLQRREHAHKLISKLKATHGSDGSLTALRHIAVEIIRTSDVALIEIARELRANGLSESEILHAFQADYEKVRDQIMTYAYSCQPSEPEESSPRH
jgi:DNA-binding transcriptional MerR regulator